MISCNKTYMQTSIQVSSKSMSNVLSKNIIGVILGFCNLNTLSILVKIDKKFRIVLSNLPIFSDFITEMRNSFSFSQAKEIFDKGNSDTSYITQLKNKLLIKYNYYQVNDFLIEVIKSLLNQLTVGGELYLGDNSLGENVEDFKILSEALKFNETITELYLGFNSLGEKEENFRNFSEALKVNQTITVLNLRDNSLGKYAQNSKNLSEALKVNRSITNLYLGRNYLGNNSENMENLTEALKINQAIHTLYLVKNSLGDNLENLEYLRVKVKR
jgi:hypothetical protein